MEKQVIIEVWDHLTQILVDDEIIHQFEFTPDVSVLEIVLPKLGHDVELIDRRTPDDLPDTDEAFYDEVIDDPTGQF